MYQMRINNKYLRNKAFRNKHWNRIRRKSHPFDTYNPYGLYSSHMTSPVEEQIRRNFEWIEQQARALESGNSGGLFHATSGFRRMLNSMRKAQERTAMARIRNGNYDTEMPKFKNDADWFYF